MAKSLKINIKNTQLAEAFKKIKTNLQEAEAKPKIPPKVAHAKKSVIKPKVEEEIKPKVRIVKEVVEEEKPKVRIVEKAEETPVVEEAPKVAEPVIPVITTPAAEILEVKKEEVKTPPEPPKVEAPAQIKEEPIEEKGVLKGPVKRKEEPGAFKSFKDFKTLKKGDQRFDSRDRMGLTAFEEESWRKKRAFKIRREIHEEKIVRPKKLRIKMPISLKDLAVEMKLKSSELISKLFMQGMVLTLNDLLIDETMVQLLGHDFDCEIGIDTSEADWLRITDKSIKEEIAESSQSDLIQRPPVVAFMGHVDHGKTSLIDAIRSTNLAAQEAGAITQHIGAFYTQTKHGIITILDTPGHEAFQEMRNRGALVTDVVVLVIAGDEGMREQTLEALNQAKAAKVTIIVAINKCDKNGFDQEKVYRQLADVELLPEAWGGTVITVNCSAVTKQGIDQLLEMILLQAEVLELKANPKMRARGTILESEMHKGLGVVATVLVQNGTLHQGDAIVFGTNWGRVKTMHDQFNKIIQLAGPSMPTKITGLSDLAEAGCELIVVKDEKEARDLALNRQEKLKKSSMLNKKSLDLFMEKKESSKKKILPLVIRADVQGSLEALKKSLSKLPQNKVEIHVISEGIGEISESDVELASTAKAVILGFHTRIENHAETFIKELKVKVKEHDIIYHVVDDVKQLMIDLLDKIEEEKDKGEAKVKALFKSSQFGVIAGSIVTEGSITRSNLIRVVRDGNIIWKGKLSSLKRNKDDVKEVQKGVECGILLENFSDFKEGDVLQAYEINYLTQEL